MGTVRASDKEIAHWLVGSPDEVYIETVSIEHPSFTRKYHFARNAYQGIRAKDHSGYYRDFEFMPLNIKAGESTDNLKQSFIMGFGDVGEVMPREIDRLRNGSYPNVKPKVSYSVYSNKDYSAPVVNVRNLEVTDNQPQGSGAVFTCRAKELNKTSTGVVYDYDEHPSLRGF